jgi:LuxR family maltose regulon positive regulatory protein
VTLSARDRKILVFLAPLLLIAAYWFLLLAPKREEVTAADYRRELIEELADPGMLPALLQRTSRTPGPAPGRRAKVSASLTERELAVLRLLPTRLSTREIGYELHVSVNTVRSQARSVYRKLGATSRAEAVTQARQLGLLSRR